MSRYLLAIESSCDDSAVAVVGEDRKILANVVSSQTEAHRPYFGVVPEIAGREHLKHMPLVYKEALAQSGLTLDDMVAIAVTSGPGLVGSLMVGLNFAKGLALASGLPLISVNHIRGHLRALFLEYGEIPLPALALIVSGGHTHLLLVERDDRLVLLTKTRDDSAGEAFDKLSKMMGLGFPGGPIIDRLARRGDENRHEFRLPRFSDGSKDYSFSGLKTAALTLIQKDPALYANQDQTAVYDLAASFQKAVVRHLMQRVKQACTREQPQSLLLGGGVACNSSLRKTFEAYGNELNLPVFLSSPKLSNDNAAMIGAEGWRLFHDGCFADLSLSPDLSSYPFDDVRLL